MKNGEISKVQSNLHLLVYLKGELLMDLINICIYADGYYSDASYEENRTITKKSYNRLKDKINNLNITIGGLDGKHSEVLAEIDIQEFNEDFQFGLNNECRIDGEALYYPLKELFEEIGLDLDSEITEVNAYIDNLDNYVTYEFRIRKSNYDKVKRFVEALDI